VHVLLEALLTMLVILKWYCSEKGNFRCYVLDSTFTLSVAVILLSFAR